MDVDAIRELTAAIRELTATIRAANESQDIPVEEPACGHPVECVVDVSSMGTGPKWVCLPQRGGCGFSVGFDAAELLRMGLTQH